MTENFFTSPPSQAAPSLPGGQEAEPRAPQTQEKYHLWITQVMLAKELRAPYDTASQNLDFTNNRNVLPGVRAAGRASPVSLQCSSWWKEVSYKVSVEPSHCFLLPSSHAGKGRREDGSRASLGKEPKNQVDGMKMLPLGLKASFAPSGRLQPSWEGKHKWVTKCRENTGFLSHLNVSLGRRGKRCLRIIGLLQSYKQWWCTMNLLYLYSRVGESVIIKIFFSAT